MLLTIAALATGLAAHATISNPITIKGMSQTSGNQTMGAGAVSSPWSSMSTPVQSGSSYTFNNVVMRGDATVTLNGTLNFQESTSLTDVVTATSFTVTIESSSTTNPFWFISATVKTGSDGAVSGCTTEVSSNKKTLTVTIPAGKTFGKIVVSYATHEPISSSNTVISGVENEYIYYGSPVKPVPIVTYNGTVLTEGTDYTYYINGGDGVGNASIFVDGAGEYAGRVNKSYTVRNLAPSDFNSLGTNTYEIASTDDLDRLAMLVNIAENDCSGITFKQTANIAYAPTTAWNTNSNENNFTAIGGYGKPFSGTYDGQGYTISGIRINKSTDKYQGLFGNISGTVKNVVLANTRITGYNYTGGIAGVNDGGNIEDCRVESNVSVNSDAETTRNYGGIVGECSHGGTISRCTFSGEITVDFTALNHSSSGKVGGIVGNLTSATVSNCLVLGATIISQQNVGAIVGDNSGTITANYYHDTKVRNSDNSSDGGAYINVGAGNVIYSEDQDGARSVHALTLPANVTATGESVDIDGVTHYASNTTVTLAYSNLPAGKKPVYSVGGNAIEGDTFVMPAADATVTVNLVPVWSGSGTSDAPYIITTTAELDELAAAGKSGETYSNTYFELGNDIAYSTTGLGDTDENFITIGGYFDGSDKNFSGIFDGKGFTISGIRLYKNPGNSGNVNKNQAVFGRAVGATIKNVTIDDARITGYRIVAGLVGNCNGTTVENCLVLNSTITCGNTYVGAIIGQNNNGTYTANYYHACTVNGTAGATNVGVGANGNVNASSDRAGVRSVHTLGRPLSVTATGECVVINGPIYFAAGTTVTLSYIGTPPQGTRFHHFTVDGEPIEGDTFTMPAHDTDVRVEYQSRYTFDSETGVLALIWGAFNKDDKWDDDVEYYSVNSVTATDEVRFTGDCSGLFSNFHICTSMDLGKVNTDSCANMADMFENCVSLNSLDLSGWNTASVTNMSTMFYGCHNLDSLNLSGWYTANVTDMNHMFSSCENLATLDVTHFDTGKVTDMNCMFWGCSSLNPLDVTHFDTGNVTNMGYMFSGCENLASLDVTGFDTGNVTDMRSMFKDCENLATLDVTHFDTGNVTDMSHMFWGCSSLNPLDVTHFDTNKVTDMSYMFSDCENLDLLDLSGWHTGSVTDMSCMFQNCLNLGSLDLSGWYTGNVTNMTEMFSSCTSLTTIYAGAGWNIGRVLSSNGMFANCTSLVGGMGTVYDPFYVNGEYGCYDRGDDGHGYLTGVFTLTLPDDVTSTAVAALTHGDVNLYAGGDTITLSYGGELVEHQSAVFAVNGNAIEGDTFTMPFENVIVTVTVVDVPRYTFDSANDVLKLNWGAFNKDDKWGDDVTDWKVKSVTATDEVRFTGDCESLFENFYDCTSMSLSKVNTDSCTSMAYMFSGCENLTSLDLSGWNTGNVTNMGTMFIGCENLASLDVTHFDTGNVTHMNSMFSDCRSLDSLDVSHFDTGNVTDMACMFSSCRSLASLDVTHFDTGNVTNMGSMFNDCTALASLDVTGFDTGNVTHMARMFAGCESLDSLDVTHFVTGNVTNMSYMFTFCEGLESLDVTHFDTGNVNDMSYMFMGCESLDSLNLSGWNTANVTDMSYMFDNCCSLVSLNLSGWNTAKVTDMTEVFFDCQNLASLDLSGWNTASITNMFGLFYNCTNLTTIYAGAGWSAENAASYGSDMFYECTSLVGGMGTAYDAEHVNGDYGRYDRGDAEPGYLTGVFTLTLADDVTTTAAATLTHGDVNLYAGGDTITLSYGGEVPEHQVAVFAVNGNAIEGDTFAMPFEDVTVTVTFGEAPRYTFDSETGVLALIWGAFNKDDKWGDDVDDDMVMSVTATDEVRFTGDCSNLFQGFEDCKSMDLSKVNTDSCTNMSKMFSGLEGLKTLDLSGWNTGNVTDMSFMFRGCEVLDTLDVSHFDTGSVTDMSGMFVSCGSRTSLDLSGWNTGKVTNMSEMFYGSEFKTLNLSGWNTGRVTDMSEMFMGCTFLDLLDVSGWNTGNVTDMSDMFYLCEELESLDLSGWNTGNVTDMSEMFTFCEGLESLDVSGWNTGNVTDMSYIFMGCTNLGSLDVSGWNTGNVTDMSGVFAACISLDSLDVTSFDTGNVTSMYGMFYQCSGLETLDLSHFDTGNVIDMNVMFTECTSLTTIYAGAGWNTENVIESSGMFLECTNLVGSMGTAYNEDHTDVEYARIDGGTESPGYLTGLFSITLPNDIEHGTLAATQGDKVLVNGDMVVTGSTVTLAVTPDKGYKLQSITVTIVSNEDEPSGAPMRLRGGTVDLTDGDEPNTYTFAMPAAPVAVNAVFKKSTPTDIDDINADKPTNGQRYNLLGQPVGPDYKGIVIENGRKIYVE